MSLVLAVVILLLIAFFIYRDLLWEQRLSKLQVKAEAELAHSRAEGASERVVAAKERKELYQRIQAPEIAVHEAQLEKRRERPYTPRKPIGADDDAAFLSRGAKTGDG